jgi:hypothetical protein
MVFGRGESQVFVNFFSDWEWRESVATRHSSLPWGTVSGAAHFIVAGLLRRKAKRRDYRRRFVLT